MDVVLLAAAFWLLATPSKRNWGDALLMFALVVGVSAGRVLMQPLPNIQPVTVACLLVGASLGARRGAAFAVLVAMLSNFFIGDGWWTLFQAGGWALVAVFGSQFAIVEDGRLSRSRLMLGSVISAFIFTAIASLSIIDSSYTVMTFLTYLVHGIPYDLLHALGNLTIAIWAGNWLFSILDEDLSLEELEIAVVEGNVIEG